MHISERNKTIALIGAIAIVMLILVFLSYALITGRPLEAIVPTLLGFATPTIVSLMGFVVGRAQTETLRDELADVHEKVNGNFTGLAAHNKALTDTLTALLPAPEGAHRKDTDDMPTTSSPASPSTLHFTTTPDLHFTPSDPASADDDRTVSGLALPFGEMGAGSRGKVMCSRGVTTLPPDLKRIKLLSDHTGTPNCKPIGFAIAAQEKDGGIYMSFHIADTPDGNAALKEVREGVRDALSVELHDAQVSGVGALQAGLMTAVALVPTPAFPSARVLKASLMGGTDITIPTGGPRADDELARVGSGITFGRQAEPMTFDAYVDNIMRLRTDPRNEDLHAALDDITIGGQPYVQAPSYIGELWSGLTYQRRIVPLMGAGKLTSQKIVGWRWKTKPEVSDYAGDKAAIPTNPVETEAAETTAKRLAGGHDIDRAFFDFPNREFLDSYFRCQGEDYAFKSDGKAGLFLAANATDITVAEKDLIRAAARARQRLLSRTRGQEPNYFLVNPDDMFDLLDFTTMDNPAYLKLVGVDPEKFIPAEQVPPGAVIAGAKAAATFYELPGSPIRVQAEHIAQGGRDAAVFGYWGALLHDARGIVSVPFTADAAARNQAAATAKAQAAAAAAAEPND